MKRSSFRTESGWLAVCFLWAAWIVTSHSQDVPPRAIPVAPDVAPRAIAISPEASTPLSVGRVSSSSGQFRISGGDPMVRGSVAMLAEEAKTEFLTVTGEKDAWKVPVVIQLHGRQGDPLPARTIAMKLLQIEDQQELHLDVHLSRGLEHEQLKQGVTTALVYERALAIPAEQRGNAPLNVPVWLSEGLREAVAWRQGVSDRRLYGALFRHGGLFRMEEILAVTPFSHEAMDGATRAAYRVSCGALVMALLEQPDGSEGFRSFLNDVALHQGEIPILLRKHFPELNLSETSLAKWWALQLATKGGLNQLTDILSIAQTESALVEALHLHLRTPEGIAEKKPIDAWPELLPLPETERSAAVRPAQDALVRLSYRCFPSYRPLLSEYQSLLADLVKQPKKSLAARFDALSQTRQTQLARSQRARDYLDWFEITRARETSGAFEDYLKLKERLKSIPKHRNDSVSKYLDRMDALFYRP